MSKKDEKKLNTNEDSKLAEEQTASASDDSVVVGSKVEELEARVKSLEDQLKRAVADYQNLEKRIAEGRSELTTWAAGEILQKLLPVVDHLDKALSGMSDEEKQSGWAKGVAMSVGELKTILKHEGLDEVSVDMKFDPNLHEAVDMQNGEDGVILEVVEKGYSLKGKILKPARVVVGRKES